MRPPELDCDGMLGEAGTPIEGSSGVDGGSLTSIGYVDGLGRARAALATGADTEGPRRWVRSGLSRFSRKGEVIEAYQPDFFGGSDASFAAVVAINYAMPSSRAVYDAFGRARYSFAEDGALNVTSYHALSTDVCDPLDNDPSSPHAGTCTTARTDGHGRLIDQILRNRPIDNPFAGLERHRLWTYYRADGAVRWLVRSQTDDENPRPDLATALGSSDPHVAREFIYDSINRRIASNDPDTDDLTNPSASSRTWRYLFNRVGDLVAVRDPRGCGQNFYYDVGGRLLAEDYVSCAEAQSEVAEAAAYDVPVGAIALSPVANGYDADVRYFYDDYPDWIGSGIDPPMGSAGVSGRATGVADRGQRSAVAYDDRGNAVWTARQMAVISAAIALTPTTITGSRPSFTESSPSSGTVLYDDSVEHTYVRTASFDHAARPTEMTLPADPDWDPMGMDPSPDIRGNLEYDRRGLPARALLTVGELDPIPVVSAIEYLRDGLVSHIEYGDLGSSPVVESDTEYDVRRRPTRMTSTREPSPGAMTGELGEVSVIHDQRLEWDTASNLTALIDERLPSEWPDGFRPQTVEITHDSLYRVVGALFHYSTEEGDDGDDDASDWRSTAAASNAVDPMRPNPAAMVGTASTGNRVRSLVWEWDWLGNMTEWSDDAQQFYERSIGDITNGQDLVSGGAAARPSALYVTSNLEVVGAGGGWVEVDYGAGGNVTQLTVHGECIAGSNPEEHGTGRVEDLSGDWVCETEQHFEYRWDELNRIVEARRWDRTGGPSSVAGWTFEARQRYRYDGANQRTVKESFDTSVGDSRVALYVYPGDFERRGVVRGSMAYETPSTGYDTETQYLIAGARLVWDHSTTLGTGLGELDQNRRLTMGVTDLIGTTAASVDLLSGELLEVSTYYPNGAGDPMNAGAAVPLEPMGFTGKEADEDVGLVYFGERYLLARLGRWASADPLHVHASGGGEKMNAYHYVSGNLVNARDMLGLATTSSTVTLSNPADASERPHPVGGDAQAAALNSHIRTSVEANERGWFGYSGERQALTDDGEAALASYRAWQSANCERGECEGTYAGASPQAVMWLDMVDPDSGYTHDIHMIDYESMPHWMTERVEGRRTEVSRGIGFAAVVETASGTSLNLELGQRGGHFVNGITYVSPEATARRFPVRGESGSLSPGGAGDGSSGISQTSEVFVLYNHVGLMPGIITLTDEAMHSSTTERFMAEWAGRYGHGNVNFANHPFINTDTWRMIGSVVRTAIRSGHLHDSLALRGFYGGHRVGGDESDVFPEPGTVSWCGPTRRCSLAPSGGD